MDRLYIVIPAYNEEMNIEQVARQWHEVVQNAGGNGSKLVIIDDGSTDGTYRRLCELERSLPLLEVRTKPNSGHGATVLFGYRLALEHGAEYIFQTDSDGQTLPSEFSRFWEQRALYGAVIGHRIHRQDGLSRIFVTQTLRFVLLCIFGLRITDANTPFRLMKREVLAKYIAQIPERFNLSNVMLTVLMEHGGENIRYLPITFRPRQGGVNSISFRKIIPIGMKAVRDFMALKITLSKSTTEPTREEMIPR